MEKKIPITPAWTPPSPQNPEALPAEIIQWLDQKACATLATVEPDGRPQLSIVWAHHEDNRILIATVAGRRKHKNLLRNPQATVLVTHPESQDHYVEVRGRAEIIEAGGRELIDFLHEKHRGTRPYPWDAPGEKRVIVSIVPERILVFHG
ncbi:PPOX class F420-dependent oxidoreductase [Streptomyces sp. NBC_00893]|uniref:PPOX class F420-dependent oxidoreductase n=1 Tax=Streptomyces sp. NBC_00893 TaxID=2975862 RepID=UPI0022549EEE|nr:PPOX class F420-dependent oxidoreductase [Streptomyces sp. NBC_00893]MCX4850463.1 PPOX class F420-dependent oxidoreductase [Streptomyces sp. NBC_00893]